MGKLHYTGIMSLDGYIADEQGKFDWAMPDEELHAFVNDLSRPIGTHLYGRRMYEVMSAWETMDDPAPTMTDFAQIWRSADKIVYSTTLTSVSSARTRIEPAFDPKAVQALKDAASDDLTIAGPGLAAHAVRADLVDEYHLFVNPIVVGGGTRYLPDGARIPLELAGQQSFGSGVVYLHYRP